MVSFLPRRVYDSDPVSMSYRKVCSWFNFHSFASSMAFSTTISRLFSFSSTYLTDLEFYTRIQCTHPALDS
ncbi:Protein of unknown function [Pyronema omphalodes CBS 100304]|uniref:Uncharacterized protein n=1 Tax=Pyronema omphalodes (strain CBS 100304) TaxID=1076935 RepID=U4LAA7_PYROM|nr:Protein of unknown function [Pyronema omphalodes CBS 100304]